MNTFIINETNDKMQGKSAKNKGIGLFFSLNLAPDKQLNR